MTMDEREKTPPRTYEEEARYVTETTPTKLTVSLGFVEGMRVPGEVYVNEGDDADETHRQSRVR